MNGNQPKVLGRNQPKVHECEPTKGSWMKIIQRFINGNQPKVHECEPTKDSWMETIWKFMNGNQPKVHYRRNQQKLHDWKPTKCYEWKPTKVHKWKLTKGSEMNTNLKV